MLADGVIRICFREEDFHARLFEPLRLAFLGLLVFCEAVEILTGPHALVVYWLWAPAYAFAAALLTVFLTTRWFRYHVGPEDIEGYDFWGRSRISWKAISRCRRINFFGVEYLLIQGRSQRNVWVPLCVDRYDVLRRLLLSYADPRHGLENLLPESA